ncbi:MAG: hypothetical protein HC855_05465 [Rhizobiales bacterium]|nr:hypothetical protein [Hyphomicrobiales bacterium]
MAELRTIEIDFEVHKKIEMERQSFAEMPNSVLRRLLKIDPQESRSNDSARSAPQTGGRSWAGKGVMLPHGTELRMEYNGRVYSGRIENGRWFVEGKAFKSPSAAAGGVALTKSGLHPSLDGWTYWYVKQPGETDWAPIATLRRR